MIQIIQNVITDEEIQEFLDYFNNNLDKKFSLVEDTDFKYSGISILHDIEKFTFLNKLKYKNYERLRIQHIDNSIDMLLVPHTHTPPYSYVIFLNDNFEGGELIFENIRIKPKKGQMVYFSREEKHYVDNVICGNRYTLVSFTKDGSIDLKRLKSQII